MSKENQIEFHVSKAGLQECCRVLTLLDGMRSDTCASFIATDEQGVTHECEIPPFAMEIMRKALMLVSSGETVIVLTRSNPSEVLARITPQGTLEA